MELLTCLLLLVLCASVWRRSSPTRAKLLTCLLLLALAGTASAAPVPRPEPLAERHLVGRWRFEWVTWERGVIWLHDDGEYVARQSVGDSAVFFGKWWLESGGVLVLPEWAHNPDTGATSGPTRYRIEFTRGTTGVCNGAPVRLSGRTP